MADKAEVVEGRTASTEELELAFSGPAVASNRVFMTLVGSGIRIAFTEQHGDMTPQFRAAGDQIVVFGMARKAIRPEKTNW